MSAPKSIYRTASDAWYRRKRASAVPRTWDVGALAEDLRAEVAAAEEDGLLDPRLLDDYEADVVALLERTLPTTLGEVRDAVGVGVAERVFGDRVYKNRLDKQLATGAAAVADVVVEEALMVVASAVSLRFYATQRKLEPVWPPGPRGGVNGGRPGDQALREAPEAAPDDAGLLGEAGDPGEAGDQVDVGLRSVGSGAKVRPALARPRAGR